MAGYQYDIGIIGGGSAGLTAAAGAAQLGAATLLVEKEKELGGDCLHFGCVPSKTLIKTARVYHMIKNAGSYGLPETNPPAVDFQKVSERIRSVIAKIQKHDSEERFCALGAKVVFGDAVFLDPYTIEASAKTYSARKWIVATGSSPSVPPVPGLRETPHATNKEIFYLDKLPEQLVILGAGPIGVEMAQAFARLGSQVTVIDMARQILNKEDKDMADAVMKVLEGEGVNFHLDSSILEIRDSGDRKEILVNGAAGKTCIVKGDTILAAMGRTPNTSGLGLEQIGVELNRGAVKVDDRMRSTVKNIFAAGDAIGGHLFTHAAGYEAGIAVSNAVVRLPRKADYSNLPWCTFTDPELASIGMNEKSATEAGVKYSVWTENFEDNDRSLAEGSGIGKVKLLLDEKEKPIGAQLFGPRAGELVNEWVAVMNGNVKMTTLAGAVHPYPTIGEINKSVAGNFLSTKIFSDTVKKGLKFFFKLKGRACSIAR